MKADTGISRVKGAITRQSRAVFILLLALALVGGIGFGLGSKWHSAASPAYAAQALSSEARAMEEASVGVAEELIPAVVHIRVESLAKPEEQQDYFAPFRPFMPDLPQPQPKARPKQGLGSGVIIDPAGYILTNVHVVAGADQITVVTADEKEYKGTVVGTDSETDLAVVKIDAGGPLPAARLGNADQARIGSWVMAVGSPFGLEATVTTGVISAKGRTLRRREEPYSPFRDLIQTDAAINQGNSGGPLVNLGGEVIGINQAIFSPGPFAGNVGIGFAIPINPHTLSVIASIKQGEPFVRGRLGVFVRDVEPALAEIYGVKKGAFVEEVTPDSPASQSGIKEEDIIVAYNGQAIDNSDQLVAAVQQTRPGSEVKVRLFRAKKEREIVVTIGEKKAGAAAAAAPGMEIREGRLGLKVGDLTPETAETLGIDPDTQGVLVEEVNPTGDAARAGIRPGDIIIKVNLTPVRSLKDYQQAVAKLKAGRPATIRHKRGDVTRTVIIEQVTE
jgi:serine protease Do